MHHRTIEINHQPDARVFQFIILTFVYSSTCFGHFPAHHQELNGCSGSLWFYLCIVVIVVLHQIGDLFELNVKLRCQKFKHINPLNAELNHLCHLLALLGVHHFFHVSRIRVK